MYYSYHNNIKKKIKEGKLIGYEYVEEYHNIKPALLLYFENGTIYPIRESSWYLYYSLLNKSRKV
ncbi:MAG: hypothetical protein E7184_03845 [Erysipelotrichaceae bacterium]|nr:hypothetical protein [Erysipelotrichaceae bacterium]